MESAVPTSASEAAAKCPSFSSPIKPATRSSLRSQSRSAPSDQIVTPEKPIELPRFTRSRGAAYSLKQVKKVALGLHGAEKSLATGPSKGDGSSKDIACAEEQVGAAPSANLPQRRSTAKPTIKLPEKYEMLGQFFHCMETSIRLLRLKGQMSSFSNICPKIEYLTDRRFSYGHLAQLKHILPEAITLKKVLSHDDATCCMKPDLQINLLADASEDSMKRKQETGYSSLTKTFRTRLVEYFKEHPEGDDVPEEALPEPFNQKKTNISNKMTENLPPATISSSFAEPSDTVPQQQFAVPSHLSGSFQRRFSQKALLADKTACMSDAVSSKIVFPFPSVSSPIKCASKPPIGCKLLLASSVNQLPLVSSSVSAQEASKEATDIDDCPSKDPAVLDRTPPRLASTPARLMTNTPELKTPKRQGTSMDDDQTPVNKRVRRPLSLTPMKTNKPSDEKTETNVDDAILKFLPKTLLQSVRDKERKAMEDQEAGVSERKRRQKMVSCLPKLFDIILLEFQSARRSVLTKQELVSKIIACNFDIVDKSEVEEQLNLLQELVPDWISGKMSLSGDFIICVNKIASPELMRQRLAAAK